MRLFVVGMHRSGTSVLVRLLEGLGFFAGQEEDFHPPTEHDPQGHREHVRFWQVNEAVLAAAGRAWDDPWPLDPAGRANPEIGARVQSALAAFDGHRNWVAKDPRFCLTLPVWRRHIAPVNLLVHRDPLAVARSLAARGDLPVFGGIALWEAYQRAAIVGSAGLPRIFVSYADFTADPAGFTRELAARLQTLEPGLRLRDPDAAARHFDPRMWRQKTTPGEVAEHLNPAQARLFGALEQAAAAPDELDRVAAEPLSTTSGEVLRVLADQRKRLLAFEQRDKEISLWNDHLWSRLQATTAESLERPEQPASREPG